jgi:hypothetical protein
MSAAQRDHGRIAQSLVLPRKHGMKSKSLFLFCSFLLEVWKQQCDDMIPDKDLF